MSIVIVGYAGIAAIPDPKAVEWVGPGDRWRVFTGSDLPITPPISPSVVTGVTADDRGVLSKQGGDVLGSAVRTLKSFGAVGDGVADDTSSVFNALQSGLPIEQIGGSFLIFSQISASVPVKLTMTGGAEIVLSDGSGAARAMLFSASGCVVSGLKVKGAATAEVVRFSGSGNQIDKIDVDGKGQTKYGLYLENPGASIVTSPTIRNCLGPSTVYPAIGLFAYGAVSGLKIIDPRISDITAPKVGAVGESPGASRAIAVQTALTAGEVAISGGRLERITGREGDAIHIQSSGNADEFVARIVGVEVIDCDRRAVKTQCGVSRIYHVVHRTVGLTQSDIPIGIASINTFSADIEIADCDVDARLFDFGIVANYTKKGSITGNTVRSGKMSSGDAGWAGRASQVGIYIGTAYGVSAKNNTVEGGYYGMRAASAYQFAIDDNQIYDSKSAHIYIDADAENGSASGNRFYDLGAGNVGSYGVQLRGTNVSVLGNRSLLLNPGTKTHNTVYIESTAVKTTAFGNASNASYLTVVDAGSTGSRIYENTNSGTSGVGASNIVAAAGDANATAPAAPYATVVYSAPITADRAVSVSSYTQSGDVLRVSRTAASTGAFSVIIGASLKSLSPGQWAEITYTGSAWGLTASGGL